MDIGQRSKLNYKNFKNLYNKLYRSAKIGYTRETYNVAKNNAKSLWQLINASVRKKVKKGLNIPNFLIENGVIFDNYRYISEGFNDFFINIGQNLQTKLPTIQRSVKDYLGTRVLFNFKFALIHHTTLNDWIKKLKPKASQGLDILSNRVIKQLFPLIPDVINKLVNMSLTTSIVPRELRTARVITIFKEGDKNSFTNYRPISLISAFGKFLEKIVCKQIVDFFNLHDLFYNHQYGFRKGHDTTHPLLHFTNNVKQALNQDRAIYNIKICIDLKKAFDTVPFDCYCVTYCILVLSHTSNE